MPKKIILPILLVLLLSTLGWILQHKTPAPAARFNLLSGESLSSSSLRGKVVLVNFWATTCSGCVAEMPKLVETYNLHHSQGFEVIAVAMQYDDPDHVRAFAKTRALPFTIALDSQGSISKAFNDVRLTPTAILIDKEGNILSTTVGDLDFASLNNQIIRELGRVS